MPGARHPRRVILAAITTVALLTGPRWVFSAAGDTRMAATTAVNVRRGPSTASAVVGRLSRGQVVTAVSTAGGWTRVRHGSGTAYVSSRYLSPAPASGTVRPAQTTTALNLRRGPGVSYGVIRVLPAGARVSLTGRAERGFSELTYGASRGWASTQYLRAGSGLPAVIGTRTATADLRLQTSSGSDSAVVGEVAKGTRLAVTGTVQNGRAQIVYRGAVRWVTARYLTNLETSGPAAPGLPRVVGTRYATADLLIRSTYADTFTTIDEVPAGTALEITGVVRNARMQIVFNGAVRWVTARYLSTTPPAAGIPASWAATERRLRPNTIALHRRVRRTWPQITTIYGWRRTGLSPDHPAGRALDLMIPGYRTAAGRALGERVARWAQANNADLKIEYIIWNQRIWNVRRAREGWRPMANRGGDSANHKDHVHITVLN